MRQSPKPMQWLLAAAYITLLIAIWRQNSYGELTGNWRIVQFGFLLLNLALILGLPIWKRT
jgi:hypothetical protein